MSSLSRDERGAGSVLAVAIVTAVIVVTASALPLYMGFAESRRLAAVADAAALAAADTASGAVPGVPCEAAAAITGLSDVELVSCDAQRAIASVTVRGSIAGIALEARSRAGPPSAQSERHGVTGSDDD